MSNIGNQVVAVVATLLGFIAHDFLSDAKTVPAVNTDMVVAAADVDPIVTRSVNMENLSIEFVETTAIAPAAMPGSPANRVTARSAAVKFDNVQSVFASARVPVETSISHRDAGYVR